MLNRSIYLTLLLAANAVSTVMYWCCFTDTTYKVNLTLTTYVSIPSHRPAITRNNLTSLQAKLQLSHLRHLTLVLPCYYMAINNENGVHQS
jgi:hypothetical protein